MLDPKAVTQLVEQQIEKTVNDQVLAVLSTDQWLNSVESKLLNYTQDRILGRFANSSALPEIVDAVKQSVRELFDQGHIPGVDQYVKTDQLTQAIDQAVETRIVSAVDFLAQDPVWLKKIETLINQTMINKVVARLSAVDVERLIQEQVNSSLEKITDNLYEKLNRKGIEDRASKVELTVIDDHVVVENRLVANTVEAVETAQIKNLVVTGTINTDNRSWNELQTVIAEKTLAQLTQDWQQSVVNTVAEQITENGIDFDSVKIQGKTLIENSVLTDTVTESSLQSVGALRQLQVRGESHFNNNTMNVMNKRVGINTETPEMALGIWDEEVSLLAGKLKQNTAYFGTGRAHGLTLGVNREAQLEIDTDGLTTVKKLRVGVHRIMHANEVPGWAGTKGDIVFNANPSVNSPVFAWQCLGGHKWKVIRAVE